MNTNTREATHEQSRFITASLPDVWRLHTDAEAWPNWNSDVVAVTLDGPMAARGTLTVTTSAGGWTMRIFAVTDEELTLWGNVVDDGSRWLQTWAFEGNDTGVRVAVTTSVLGSDAAAGAALAGGLQAATDTRLNRLQTRAELHAARGA